MHHWHTLSAADTLAALHSTEAGLAAEMVQQQQAIHGKNELKEAPIKSPWKILWEQLASVMVVILLVAAVLSAVLGDFQDAGMILAIIVFFVTLGVFQEYRAEKAIAALKQLAVPSVRVRRAGQVSQLPAPELVPGDIVLLEAGDQVPADARLLQAYAMQVQEAALTGESTAVEKRTESLEDTEAGIGDRSNMLYLGTALTYGRGEAVVVSTGMQTELGKIASLLQNVESRQTPLQKRLDQVGRLLAVLAVICAGLIFALGLLRGEALLLMLMSAISVAVAAVPEGLPAVLTITLAFGSQRMLKRHALVRKLTGIETLGSVSVICSDKTGTLTQNRMQVIQLADLNQTADCVTPEHATDLQQVLLLCGVLCNDSQLQTEQNLGDPTEIALLEALQSPEQVSQWQSQWPRLDELPFDSERKRMSTLHRWPADSHFAFLGVLPTASALMFVKGAFDGLLERSSRCFDGQQCLPLDTARRQYFEQASQQLAASGYRVLGFALKPLAQDTLQPEDEEDLIFLGLMALLDPPRPEVAAAVKICQQAGIRVMMITGDHPLTALKIAQDLGISESDRVLTGRELQHMAQAQLQEALANCQVFARVSPEHKLRIVNALQAQERIVAMTGDGVNDAPALKQADIGVAMGITGTDVSKEAADMVLQDDNFATIVAAVEEGRTIYDNLRKFLKFSIAGNLGKILAMLAAPLLGMPLALLPIQMLWLNLMTDGLLGLGLGLEPAERRIMQRPPTSPDESVLGGNMRWQMVWMGLLIAGVSMGLSAIWWSLQGAEGAWQTVLFTSLAFAQIFQALGIRSSQDSLFRIGLRSNAVLLGMVALVLGLQILLTRVPLLRDLFHLQVLALYELLFILLVNSLILWVTEVLKWRGKSV
ncbi:MAG: cation-translocating P-type ATPase [Candidatus Sericytochromatia bacterium]|nr:cation-translocating P-type ATPase [Candidatus Sericytochromatia bacterium]